MRESERVHLSPPGDRVEYWSWRGEGGLPEEYVEMVYVQDETVKLPYNVFSMLLRKAGYVQRRDIVTEDH